MSLVKITFDNCSVSSKQDADCNHYLVNGQNGVVYGVLGRCQPSVSNSYINFQSGYVQAYGRRVYVLHALQVGWDIPVAWQQQCIFLCGKLCRIRIPAVDNHSRPLQPIFSQHLEQNVE